MTRFILVRHGSTDTLDVGIAGWQPGVTLNERGRREVKALAGRIAGPFDALFSSPLERTQETASVLAERLELLVQPHLALAELRFGDWTGRSFSELHGDPQWARFNSFRSGTRIPDGETMLEVQTRAVHALLALRQSHPGKRLLLVTHGDVIKALVAYVLGMSLDLLFRFDVAPASQTEIELDEDHMRLLRLNDHRELG
jgi:broad specificity phosphatase PhoE